MAHLAGLDVRWANDIYSLELCNGGLLIVAVRVT
jgi:hypothetical protein